MKLRIYAVVVSILLIAALTNPSAQKHYAELERIYPWVADSLLLEVQPRVMTLDEICGPEADPSEHQASQPPRLHYSSLGIASFVYTRLSLGRSFPICGQSMVSPKYLFLSFGIFGFVFTKEPELPPSRTMD